MNIGLKGIASGGDAGVTVTNAKLADMAQSTIKGRAAGAGTGDPTDLTATQATAILDPFTDTLKGLVPPSGGGTTTFLRADATFALAGLIRGTPQATTSGTSFDYTSLPATIKIIKVIFNEVSLSGTNDILVQIGDSGGLETTGYVSSGGAMQDGAASAVTSSTAGFLIRVTTGTRLFSGTMEIANIDGNIWISSHSGKVSTTFTVNGGGSKTLSATLDRVRILATGADTFDGGSVNIMYQ